MRSSHLPLLPLIVLLALGGCEGDEGPAGPTGPAGESGNGFPYAYDGTVATAAGPAAAHQLVLLKALDPDGRPLADIGSTTTLDAGVFSVGSTVDASAVPLGLEALAGSTRLRAFLVDTDGQAVDPVTEGVVDLVTMVTGSPEGRTLADYPAADIRTLVAAAQAALTTAGTDLSDPEAVRARLLADIGGQLADLSGGVYAISPSGSPVSVDPADVQTGVTAFRFELTDGNGELWDFDGGGAVDDGSDDSYDTMFELQVEGFDFPTQVAPGSTAMIEDGRELVLGPVTDLAGLTVTRKAYVPETGSFARFAEILFNEGGADVTVDVRVFGNLGSDESTDLVHASSDGNGTADRGDIWLTMKWDDDPTVGFYFPGAVPYKSSDDVEYTWESVVVPAGQTVVLIHWGFQDSTAGPGEMATMLAQLTSSFPGTMYAGLSIAEGAAAPYAAAGPNVVGEAGAVAPLATVDVENLTSGGQRSTTAASDGSFGIFLANTQAGDQVRLIASDGTDDTVTVQ